MPDQNDPIVLYLIVRESLNMGAGKIAAQCGHGVQKILIRYFTALTLKAKLHTDLSVGEEEHIQDTKDWLGNHASRKVVLKANEEEWAAVKEEYAGCVIIKDAGLTEVAAGTDTLISLWPQVKSKRSKTLKALRPL
jgi:peptidyl-tRNA hydrolase